MALPLFKDQQQKAENLARIEAEENERNRDANYLLAQLEANTTTTLTAMDNLKSSTQTPIIIIAIAAVVVAIFYLMTKK